MTVNPTTLTRDSWGKSEELLEMMKMRPCLILMVLNHWSALLRTATQMPVSF
jgi:hypothetical protein